MKKEPSAKELLALAQKIKKEEMKSDGKCVGCVGKAFKILNK